jgi:hypothetical protein
LCEYNHTCIRVLLRTLTEESQKGQMGNNHSRSHAAPRQPPTAHPYAREGNKPIMDVPRPHCRARGLWCARLLAGGKLATHGGQWDMEYGRDAGNKTTRRRRGSQAVARLPCPSSTTPLERRARRTVVCSLRDHAMWCPLAGARPACPACRRAILWTLGAAVVLSLEARLLAAAAAAATSSSCTRLGAAGQHAPEPLGVGAPHIKL